MHLSEVFHRRHWHIGIRFMVHHEVSNTSKALFFLSLMTCRLCRGPAFSTHDGHPGNDCVYRICIYRNIVSWRKSEYGKEAGELNHLESNIGSRILYHKQISYRIEIFHVSFIIRSFGQDIPHEMYSIIIVFRSSYFDIYRIL